MTIKKPTKCGIAEVSILQVLTRLRWNKLSVMSYYPVTPKPKTGHWIDKDEKSAVCSCCNKNNILYGDFCKWCGAKMVESQERSD